MISPLIRKREAIRRLAAESPFQGERQAAQRMLEKDVPQQGDLAGLKPWQADTVSQLRSMGFRVTFEVTNEAVTTTFASGIGMTYTTTV